MRIASPPGPRLAIIRLILIAQSTEADLQACAEGGVIVDFEGGDCWIFTQDSTKMWNSCTGDPYLITGVSQFERM